MRSALWSALLCGVGVQLAAAQGEPVTFEESQPVTVTGFGVEQANYDRAARSNSFRDSRISVSLFKPAGDAYFFGQLTTTLAPDGSVGIDIDHLWISWTPHSATQWTIDVGQLAAPLGFEADDPPLNFLATSSFNFQYARPSAIDGVDIRFAPSRHFDFVAAIANGWNVELDNNTGKTGVLRAEWLASDGLEMGITGVYGPERDSTNAFQRTLVTPDVTLQRGPLILQAEANVGWERDSAGGSPNRWAGGVVLAFLRLSRSLGVGARYDHLDDSKGVVTGVPQVLRSFEVGPMWFYRSAQQGIFSNIEHTTFHLPQIAVRAALRVDYSTQPFFGPNPAGGLERRDTQGVVEVFYIF